MILRTSEDGHFPGFSAAVVCVNTALLQGLDDGGTSLPRIDGSGVSAKLDQFVRRCHYYINYRCDILLHAIRTEFQSEETSGVCASSETQHRRAG